MGKDMLAIGDRGRRIGIARGRKDERLRLREIRIANRELGGVGVEDPDERMGLGDEEMPATSEESCHELGPAAKIREPAQNAIRGEDDIELAGQLGLELVDIGFYESAAMPTRSDSARAYLMALGEKSTPVTCAPSLPM